MINIIVTGASGMIGSKLLRLLPNDFRLVKNIDRTEGLDILNYPGLLTTLSSARADVIVHMAAFTDVNAAARQEGKSEGLCFQINVTGTRNIVKLAKQLNCQLIHISTDYVFDGTKTGEYLETDKPNPIEWYGKTKYEAEKIVLGSDIKWCIVRTAYPFLAEFPGKFDLVRSRIKQMKDGNLPPQFTDHIITPTSADQLSIGLFKLIRAKALGIYHLVGDTSLSDFDITTEIAKQFGFDETEITKSSLAEFNKSAPRPYQQQMAMSNQKFKSQFGNTFSSFPEALAAIKIQMKEVEKLI
ncbi:SDR family oxidoreductase [Candidatus Collierbacteria bacterium]|nr:SDR family oxidoreductase [Candidatus Collierbacteria bacterium]